MSKSVKALVHCRSIIDGRVNNAWDETRTVYLCADGGLWVSHLGKKRGRRAVANADGSYSVDYQARSITARSAVDVFGKLVKPK